MVEPRIRACGSLVLSLACLCILLAPLSAAAADARQGESVQAVLERMRDQGMNVIYNTTLVPGTLRVSADHQAATAAELLELVLAEHGLALRRVQPGLYAITPATREDASLPGNLLVLLSSGVSGQPLAGVRVDIAGTGFGALSDASGAVLLSGLPAGSVEVLASKPGHLAASARVELRAGHTSVLPLVMHFPPDDLQRMVVTASRYSLQREASPSASYLGRLEMESSPRLGGETLRTTHRLPGNASTGLSSRAHVRGGDQDETLILFEGLRLYQPFHLKDFQGPFSVIDSEAVESLDFYSGGFTAEYGDRMSAVIDMHALQPADTRYWQATLGTFHTSALVAGMSDDGDSEWLTAARRSNLSLLTGLLEYDLGEPDYMDLHARLQHRLSETTSLSLNTLYSSDEVRLNNSRRTEVSSAEYRNLYAWGSLQSSFAAGVDQTLRFSLTELQNARQGQVAEPGDRLGSVDDVRDFFIFSLGADWRYTWSEALVLRLGAELKHTDGNYRYRSLVDFEPLPVPGFDQPDRAVDVDLGQDGNQHALYLSGRFQPLEKWTLETGLRWDYQSYTRKDQRQLSPRLNLMYAPTPSTRLRAAWGRYYQADAVDELQVQNGLLDFFPPQRAEHAILGLEQAFGNGLQLRVEAYRKLFKDLRPRSENLFDTLQLIPELGRDRITLDTRDARAQGFELMLARKRSQGWSYWGNYSWSQAWDQVEGRHEPRSWDQAHSVNLGVAWRSGPWVVDLAATWHTGWPTTALELVTDVEGAQLLVTGPRNAQSYGDFSSLDLHVNRDFRVARGRLRVFLEITNLLNAENPCCSDYRLLPAEDGQWTLQQDQDYWLRMVPSLGVTWSSR